MTTSGPLQHIIDNSLNVQRNDCPAGLRRIPGRGSRRSCRGRDSPSELRHRDYSSGCKSRFPRRDLRQSSPSGACARVAKAQRRDRGNRPDGHRRSGHGGGSSPAAGVRRSSTACRCLRHWCGWRPGRHCACPAAGTRCSHVRCGPGVVFFRSDQSGVKAPVLEVFDYCSCDFTCVFVLPEEKENHFPMQ